MKALLAIAGQLLLASGCPAVAAQSGSDFSGVVQTEEVAGVLARIEFQGLRRIRQQALEPHLASREGEALDARRVENDVRALGRLGWFDAVRAEVRPLAESLETPPAQPPDGVRVRLIFRVQERPLLAGVEFQGSEQMPPERARAILAAAGIRLRLAAPVDRAALHRAARALRQAMAQHSYPEAEVSVRLRAVPADSVRAVFDIREGAKIEVARVEFEGNECLSDRRLRRQMQQIAPHALFAGVRGKKTFTPAALAEDLDRVATYYQDHGWADLAFGAPRVERIERRRWRWPRVHRGELPWPRPRAELSYRITVPVREGPRYRIASVEFADEASGDSGLRRKIAKALRPGEPYSAGKVRELKERLAGAFPSPRDSAATVPPEVMVHPEFDAAQAKVRLVISAQPTLPKLVRRIEFLGHQRFSDRYYRRRIGLEEGKPLDLRRLEQGLGALAAAGYIRPVAPGDVRVMPASSGSAVDLAIRIEEIGRQRFSLVGGSGQLGTTLGIVYQLFDLFGGEEVLAGRLEGGPESLQTALGLTQEALFGTRLSLGITLYRAVLRPAVLTAGGRERLFTSGSSGLGLSAGYPLTRSDRLLVAGEFAGAGASYPSSGKGTAESPRLARVTARSSTRTLTVGWTRTEPAQRFEARTAFTGGILGGGEDHLRAALAYARLASDPATRGRNSWACRGYLAGTGALGGSSLPLHARFWGGEHLLRGFRTAEITPWIAVRGEGEKGSANYRAEPAGANVLAVWNVEYRAPVARGADAAVFLDTGAGWLVPRWLGDARPAVVRNSSGAARASTGIELRLPLPLVQEKLRLFYAVNPFRAAESWLLPDGTRHRAPHRRAILGWGLGTIF